MQNKTPYQRQFEYMLTVGQIDKDGNMVESIEKQPDYLYFMQTEILEYLEAYINGNKIEMLDALADILVCILGASIKYRINTDYNFSDTCNVDGLLEIASAIHKIQYLRNTWELFAEWFFTEIWLIILAIAKRNNFNIQGAFDIVMQNNLDRMLRDELGHVVLDTRELLEDGSKNREYGKVIKIKDFPKPDLSKFIL